MLTAIIATFFLELAKKVAELIGEAVFKVKTKVRKLKPFDRRKRVLKRDD